MRGLASAGLLACLGLLACGKVESQTESPPKYQDGGVGGGDASRPGPAGDASEGAGGARSGAGGSLAMPDCGNGVLEPGEECEGQGTPNATCEQLGFGRGGIGCNTQTCRYDTTECGPAPVDAGASCRDLTGALSAGCSQALCECYPAIEDECDVECWSGIACVRRRCTRNPGDPNCGSQCVVSDGVDPEAIRRCIYEQPECNFGLCGNGVNDPLEECDGAIEPPLDCVAMGYGGGELTCTPDCRVDYSGCTPGECGNGTLDPDEPCDDAQSRVGCLDIGFVGGDIQCNPETCFPDTSQCHRCGDGLKDPDEPCDGNDFGALTCRRFGFTGGPLTCISGCELDTDSCAACGNGRIDEGESCDGTELGAATCTSLGLPDGTLACGTGCRFDVSGCGDHVATCGDNVAEYGEECDGADVLSLDCQSLGYRGGTLACSASCRLDESGCTTPPTSSCSRCREQRCDELYQQCKDSPECGLSLDCGNQCLAHGLPATLLPNCFFECVMQGTDPVVASQGVNLLMSYLSCMMISCQHSCVGEIPEIDPE